MRPFDGCRQRLRRAKLHRDALSEMWREFATKEGAYTVSVRVNDDGTALVIVRHGESERNVAKELAKTTGRHSFGFGRRDIDVRLTKTGHAQARSTGKYLDAEYNFDAIFTSPYRRTVQTADEIRSQNAFNSTEPRGGNRPINLPSC